MPWIEQPVAGRSYRFTLASGALIVGVYRGLFCGAGGEEYWNVQTCVKRTKNKGFIAAYNANRIVSIERI